MRAKVLNRKVCAFYEVAKSLGFYFRQKNKLKQKAFATGYDGMVIASLLPHYP